MVWQSCKTRVKGQRAYVEWRWKPRLLETWDGQNFIYMRCTPTIRMYLYTKAVAELLINTARIDATTKTGII